MSKIDVLFERRSVRKFTDEPVTVEALQQILSAGMAAPSARNSRPWEFIVIRDPEVLKVLSTLRPYWSPLAQAPVGILVVANLEGYVASATEFYKHDCGAATQNILLGATALGYGGVWMGIAPDSDCVPELRRLLHIPEAIIPFSLIALGRPEVQPEPHTGYCSEKVFENRYGNGFLKG